MSRAKSTGPRPARLAALLWIVLLSASGTAGAGSGKVAPGAYCPLPEKGQKPVCLSPAEEQYRDFFAGLEQGAPTAASIARVQQALESGEPSEDAYLALSSLAYGYYRLAQAAASAPDPNPVLVERLEQWNDLLSNAYAQREGDPVFRQAVRTAAEDIHARAPQVGVEGGTSSALLSTLESIDESDARYGVRGALTRIFSRMLGEESPE